MKRVKQLDTVIFEMNTMFIQEEMDDGTILSEAILSAGGNHIVYESQINTPYITLDSKENSWVTEAQRQTLMTMWKALGATYTLTYDDNTTETVRMAREKRMVFTPIIEGSDKYTVIIPLAKVV